ncbi:hypothetical protein [Ureibacillus manganicus]|uniref:Uncharacterized protein n=1 Tax=Ureibacillus manganicus DSM 26584 TaxID=1384049 RepID=A0A0A3I1Z1_9BACL|nr:hypothetical protein [Ureibacillus manganicus]KGR78811.1 hypothetical protein CD29_09000 [Ureibacillus manganicus DSM 26584]
MSLQSLLERFTSQLHPNEKCIQSSLWCLPVHTIQVTYKPVLRRQMDILMKMLLISVQKVPFKTVSQISEILLVEDLFVHDLLSKMERMGLILRDEQGFQITKKGKAQLESGIYEEDQDSTSTELLFSASHKSFLSGDLEEVLEYEDFPETIFRYYEQKEHPTIPNENLLEEIRKLSTMDQLEGETTNPIFINSVDEIEYQQINDIPCVEMIIYDENKDIIFTRIWNTLLNEWDEVLEKIITTKEGQTWKEQLLI